MTRGKSFLYNTLTTLGMYLLTVISGFLIPRVIMLYYGSEINGLVSSLTQLLGYFNLVEAGLSGAAIYALYGPLANKDWHRVSTIVTAAKKFYFQSGYIYVFLAVILSLIYPLFVKVNFLTNTEVFLMTLILGFSGAIEFFTLAKYRSLLTADQKTYIISNAQAVFIIVNTLIIVVLSIQQWDIVLVRAFALISVVLRSFILSFYCHTHYDEVDFHAIPDMHSLDKRWDALFLQIITSIQSSGTLVLATFMTDLKWVSVCAVYSMIMMGIVGAVRVLQSGLTAAFGELIVKHELSVLRQAYSEFESVFYSVAAVMLSTCFIMIIPFIQLYTEGIHDMNYVLPSLASLFVISEVFDLLKSPGGMIIISAGMYKETRWRNIIQTIILVAGGILFGKIWGIWGIIFGVLLSHIYRDMDILFFVSKRILYTDCRKTLKKWFIFLSSFLFVILLFYDADIKFTGYFQWFLYAIKIMIYSSIVTISMNYLFDRQDFTAVWQRIYKLIF